MSRQALFPMPAGCTLSVVQAAPLARHFIYGTLASLQPTGVAMGLTGPPPALNKEPTEGRAVELPQSQRLSRRGRDRCDCVSQREFTFTVTWLTAPSPRSCLSYPSLPGGGLLCIQYGVS